MGVYFSNNKKNKAKEKTLEGTRRRGKYLYTDKIYNYIILPLRNEACESELHI